ncbi:MAG: hypothetical protein R2850_00500 [Bacteroidia bacterium]
MKLRYSFSLLILFFVSIQLLAQSSYKFSIESGYLPFIGNTIMIEPGPGWKGHYLSDQCGFDLSIINGVQFGEHFKAGIGTGYMNFKQVNGASGFLDLNCNLFDSRLRPSVSARFGYSHLWNQYPGGTGTTLVEFGIGLVYSSDSGKEFYFKSGALFMQQSLLAPVRIGMIF